MQSSEDLWRYWIRSKDVNKLQENLITPNVHSAIVNQEDGASEINWHKLQNTGAVVYQESLEKEMRRQDIKKKIKPRVDKFHLY